ncbi:MAG: phospho-sugar mutase, partial [Gillisia sp.]
KKGMDGESQIKQMMVDLRENPLSEINGEKIVLIEDYHSSEAKNLQDHTKHSLDIPKSNVLIYYTEEGTKIAARPSGTEPKIKFYISVNSELNSVEEFKEASQQLKEKIVKIKSDLHLD